MNRIALLLPLALGGCATVVDGTTQSLFVETTPNGADCELTRAQFDPAVAPEELGKVKGGNSITIDKSVRPITVKCTADGYAPASTIINPERSPRNYISFISITATVVDAASGASHIYPSRVSLTLTPLPKRR